MCVFLMWLANFPQIGSWKTRSLGKRNGSSVIKTIGIRVLKCSRSVVKVLGKKDNTHADKEWEKIDLEKNCCSFILAPNPIFLTLCSSC